MWKSMFLLWEIIVLMKHFITLATFPAKFKNKYFFNFSHCFCSSYKFGNANMLHFSSSMWFGSFDCFNFRKIILEKCFWVFFENVSLFWNWSYLPFSTKAILILLMLTFFVKNQYSLAKIVPLPKVIMWDLC